MALGGGVRGGQVFLISVDVGPRLRDQIDRLRDPCTAPHLALALPSAAYSQEHGNGHYWMDKGKVQHEEGN